MEIKGRDAIEQQMIDDLQNDPEYIEDQKRKGNYIHTKATVKAQVTGSETVVRLQQPNKRSWKHTDTSGETIRYRDKRFYKNRVLKGLQLTDVEYEYITNYGFRELVVAIHKQETESFTHVLKDGELQNAILNWLANHKIDIRKLETN